MTIDGEAQGSSGVTMVADVLVIGGGPAATWAALSAALAGADTILVDKGYVGTSGATAPSTTNCWFADNEARRESIIARRLEQSLGLGNARRIGQVVDMATENIKRLDEWGYSFPVDDQGKRYLANLRGPDYMRFMRRQLLRARVKVLDHHPALELLAAGDGIGGASGVARQHGTTWTVRAAAVILATGGCAFGDRILGATGLTGDAYLMAAEAGARFSGMEFSAQYGIAPLGSSVNKGIPFTFASFFTESGRPVPASVEDRYPALAQEMIRGERIVAIFDHASPALRAALRHGQPNCFLPFDRLGIDPFQQRFPVSLRCEGTVRGTGGIHAIDETGATGIRGLYAAGDSLDRQDLAGATTGGGGPNAAWAISTGAAAGTAAAALAREVGNAHSDRSARRLGTVGLRPLRRQDGIPANDVVRAVQSEMLPLERNFFRTQPGLTVSLSRLDEAWSLASDYLGGGDRLHIAASGALREREAAAMLLAGRLAYTAALSRRERRGIHRRLDLPVNPELTRLRTSIEGHPMLATAHGAPTGHQLTRRLAS